MIWSLNMKSLLVVSGSCGLYRQVLSSIQPLLVICLTEIQVVDILSGGKIMQQNSSQIEIYLNDTRNVSPQKLKTVLRLKVNTYRKPRIILKCYKHLSIYVIILFNLK